MHVTKTITVGRPRTEVYAFWRDFENFPRFMHHLESVENIGGGRSHWRTKGIGGNDREWDAELVEDRPGERISWRTVGEDDDVRHAGAVLFRSAGDSATEVEVNLEYDPPGGRLGATLAKLFGEEPGQQIEQDLERFKRVLETGDVERSLEHSTEFSTRTQEPVEPVNREREGDTRI